MGLFDSVYVNCPHCGEPVEFQSKADEDPYMRRFSLENAPSQILHDILNRPGHCMGCNKWMALIDPKFPPGEIPTPTLTASRVKSPPFAKEHPQGMKWWPEGRPFTYDDLEAPDTASGSD